MSFIYLSFAAPLHGSDALKETNVPQEVSQGDVAVIEVSVEAGVESLKGEFDRRDIPFFRNDDKKTFTALIGVDLASSPGERTISVTAEQSGKTEKKSFPIRILPGNFGVQKITLPGKMVDLDDETVTRVLAEKQRMAEIFNKDTSERLWQGDFISPLKGEVTGTFGVKRILNGQPRSPHSGVDLAAPKGKEVLASNRGRVVLTDELYYSGKTVIIDHGLGLYTMYFHLSEIMPEPGSVVEKGDTIGLVGSTGRSTGPHLHWGVRLNDAKVDPMKLLAVTKTKEPVAASYTEAEKAEPMSSVGEPE